MANTVQIKRGNNTSVNAHTGPSGEIIYNLDTGRLHAQDGSTAGGKPHALISDVDLKANAAVNIGAGTGLTGGGTLAANRTLALSSASIASLAKADTAVQSVNGKSGSAVALVKGDVGLGNVDNTSDLAKPISTLTQTALNAKANSAVTVSAGTGLTGGGNLTANRTVALNAASIASLAKADSAIQAPGGSSGQILAKNSATTNDVVWVSSEAATAVSYGSQTLTEAQQGQARQNIQADHAYDTIAIVTAANVPAYANAIRTNGYYAAGDGGDAMYKRVAVEPAHAGKVQSADGAWWELAEPVVTPFMFGAKGDLVNDDADAINNCFAYFRVKNCSCFIPSPSKGYAIAKPLQLYLTAEYDAAWQGYRGKQISIDKGAGFKATVAMPAMLTVGSSGWEGIVRDGMLSGGRFDCANLADVGVCVPFFELVRIVGTTVWNYKKDGFLMGDAATPGISYEGMLTNCHTDRDRVAAPAGSWSVRYNNATDNHMIDCVLKGHFIAGVGGSGTWNLKLTNVHCWNNSDHGDAEFGFVLQGGNQLIGCQVDMPIKFGAFRFEQKVNFLIGCNITKDSGAVGGHFVDMGANAEVVSIGCKIQAETGHELSGEVSGDGFRNYSSIGNIVRGVNNPANSGHIRSSSTVRTGVFTVSTLPSSPLQGDRAFVTDASSTTFGDDLVGGGPNWVPVYYNGGAWKVG